MRLVAFLGLALLLAGAVAAQDHAALLAQAQADGRAAFDAYARLHGRNYVGNQQEMDRRFAVFKSNVEKIVAHNARNDASYQLGLNDFADLTTEEFRQRYFGAGPAKDLAALRAERNAVVAEPNAARRGPEHFPHSNRVPPAHIDWREAGIITHIKDQHVNGSKCGCCYAFGGLAGVEAANAKFTGEPIALAEQQIVDCDTLDYGCDGGDFTNVVRYVHKNGGVDSMADYPYLAKEDVCDKHKAEKHKVVTVDAFQEVPRANETALMQSVAFMPTIVAVCCGDFLDQWHLYKGGIFDTHAHCTSPLDHAVLVVGYGEEADGTQYWLIKNSWGTQWGEEGYMKLLRNVSDPLGQNGLVNLPPAYVVKEHPNPKPKSFYRRGGRMQGNGLLALTDRAGGWFSGLFSA